MFEATIHTNVKQALQEKINSKTKPLGSLGVLEEIALQIGCIQQTDSPQVINPHIVVFAADHGIAATGLVNPYPQAVTAQMVLNYLNGGAAINVFCRQSNIVLKVVDAGVNYDWQEGITSNDLLMLKWAWYKELLTRKGHDRSRSKWAINTGRTIVEAIAVSGCNTIGFGEMGIGNTSSASLIMSSILHMPLEECVGRGTWDG
jgi:nicotinate-nucleotide--dimethylbenzimidazole phosphoribosyltransferase